MFVCLSVHIHALVTRFNGGMGWGTKVGCWEIRINKDWPFLQRILNLVGDLITDCHFKNTYLICIRLPWWLRWSRNLPARQETQVQFLGWEDPLEKEKATYSSILAWRIPWTEGPGRLLSMGSQRDGHDLATKAPSTMYEHSSYPTYSSIILIVSLLITNLVHM